MTSFHKSTSARPSAEQVAIAPAHAAAKAGLARAGLMI